MWCRGKLDQPHARRHLGLTTDPHHSVPLGQEARCAVTLEARFLAVGSPSLVAVYELHHTPEPAHCGSTHDVIIDPQEFTNQSYTASSAFGLMQRTAPLMTACCD